MELEKLMELYKKIIPAEWFEALPVGRDCPECDIIFETGNIIRRRSDFAGVFEVLGGSDCGPVSDFVIELHNSFPALYERLMVAKKEREILLKWLEEKKCQFNQVYRGNCQRIECSECRLNHIKEFALTQLREEGVIVDET
jgi:rubredoxin